MWSVSLWFYYSINFLFVNTFFQKNLFFFNFFHFFLFYLFFSVISHYWQQILPWIESTKRCLLHYIFRYYILKGTYYQFSLFSNLDGMKHCYIYKQTLGKWASLTPCSARITVSDSCYGWNKRNRRFRCESGSALDIAMFYASITV